MKLWLVGARGFEPPTPASRTRCATELRYAPTTLLSEPLIYCPIGRMAALCPRSTLTYLSDKPRVSLRDALPCIPLSQKSEVPFVYSFRTGGSQGNPCASATAGYVITP